MSDVELLNIVSGHRDISETRDDKGEIIHVENLTQTRCKNHIVQILCALTRDERRVILFDIQRAFDCEGDLDFTR